ncbi:hypothetical protein EP837_02688 [Sphingobium sp. EP60837]|nr:hypothetical protein EP837_02688 [Sphingobium sp. EP60837]
MRRHLVAAVLMLLSTAAGAATPIIVHRDPGCGCCEKWAKQVQAQLGRRVTIIDDQARAALQRAHGVPVTLASCHTVLVDGMVFEGHVPIADMRRVLTQRPKGISGLAVAGMPLGSPGMEVPSQAKQSYVVAAFGASGTRIYARH